MKISKIRVYVVAIIMVLFGLADGAIVVYRSLYQNEFLVKQGKLRTTRTVSLSPMRGHIYSSDGEALAVSAPLFRAYVDPLLLNNSLCLLNEDNCRSTRIADLKEEKARESAEISRFARLLSLSSDNMLELIGKPATSQYKVIQSDIKPAIARQIEALSITGVGVQTYYRRFYPMQNATTSVLGVLNHKSHGISGIERQFDTLLSGHPGKERRKYYGKSTRTDDKTKKLIFHKKQLESITAGKDIELTLDSRAQAYAYKGLLNAASEYNPSSASIMVMEARTGNIRALADWPSFNPNNRSETDFDLTVSRMVSDPIEPGSLLKPFSLALALENHIIDTASQIDTNPGWYQLDRYRVKDSRNYGVLSPAEVLQRSSNVGTLKVVEKLEPGILNNFYRSLGLTEPTHLLPYEKSGRLSDTRTRVDELASSYGYGLLTNGVALARAFSAIANDGVLIDPRLINTDSAPKGKQVLNAKTAKLMRQWMSGVASEEGTAPKAKIPFYSVAGKTGTVRSVSKGHYRVDSYNAYFVGMVPADAPKYLCVVILKGLKPPKHYAGQTAANVFREVMWPILRLPSP